MRVIRGAGIWARTGADEIALGNDGMLSELGLNIPEHVRTEFDAERANSGKTVMLVFINSHYAGMLSILDMPREGAMESIRAIEALGVRVVMLSGDNASVAQAMCARLGITECHAEKIGRASCRERV